MRAARTIDQGRGRKADADWASPARQLDLFRGLSFNTISSTGANGSVIHYAPAANGESAVIDKNKIYLCDSGAQFLDGTTE